MTLTSSQALAAPTIPPWVNRVIMGILRSPFHVLLSRTTLVLTVTGRRSGRRYTFPVRYLRDGDRILVSTDSRWWRNLQGGASVSLHLWGHEVSGWAEVRTDPETVEQSIRAFLSAMPHDASFYQITLDRSGQPDVARLKQAVQDRVLITISLGGHASQPRAAPRSKGEARMNQDHAAFPDRVGTGRHRKQLNRERGTQMQVKALVGSGDKIGLFTLPFVLLGVLLNILYPAFFSVGGPSLFVTVIALLLFIPGVIIWLWSVILIVTNVPQQHLITTGPYALVKHPLYTGVALLVLPGLGLLLNTWVGIVIGITLYIGSRRFAPEEETLLAKTFGTTWEEYRKQVKIPWL